MHCRPHQGCRGSWKQGCFQPPWASMRRRPGASTTPPSDWGWVAFNPDQVHKAAPHCRLATTLMHNALCPSWSTSLCCVQIGLVFVRLLFTACDLDLNICCLHSKHNSKAVAVSTLASNNLNAKVEEQHRCQPMHLQALFLGTVAVWPDFPFTPAGLLWARSLGR